MIQEVKVRLLWLGGQGDTGSQATVMALNLPPIGLEGDRLSLCCPLSTPRSGLYSGLLHCLPHLVNKYHSCSRTTVLPWQKSGDHSVPCPSAPRGAVGLGAMPQGDPLCPHSGLELKLEVQGECTGVSRHSVNVGWAILGLGGVGGKRSPPPHLCRSSQSTGSSWAHSPPGKLLRPGAALSSCWSSVLQTTITHGLSLTPHTPPQLL